MLFYAISPVFSIGQPYLLVGTHYIIVNRHFRESEIITTENSASSDFGSKIISRAFAAISDHFLDVVALFCYFYALAV